MLRLKKTDDNSSPY